MRARVVGERGGSNALAAVLLVPVVMLAILGTLQAGIWYHGRQTALRAAQSAAEAERVLQPEAGAGQLAADTVGRQGGLEDMSVSVSRGATTVTVVLSARVPMFFDIGVGRFTEQVTMPRERVTQP